MTPLGLSLEGVTHHRVRLKDAELHYVLAGTQGPPLLLVHGFPESWWTFRKLIPLLAASHRVVAVDLRGFGDSSHEPGDYGSAAMAQDLQQLIESLDLGPMHLTCQDISGAAGFRLAVSRPDLVSSFTAIEMGLAGFGLEALADVSHGGAWHIGVLATPGIAEMLLVGRERAFLADYAFAAMTKVAGAFAEADIEEFARVYSVPHAWRGATGLYASMLKEGRELVSLAEHPGLPVPVLAIDAGGWPMTSQTMAKVTKRDITAVHLDGVGHYAAMEAPEQLAETLAEFVAIVEGHLQQNPARPSKRT